MRRLLLIIGVLLAGALPAQAQTYFPFGSVNVGTTSTNVRVGPLGCYVTTSDPTYTNGQVHPCSLTTAGRLRVDSILPAGTTLQISEIIGPVALPAGAATAVKQPALGTAGTPSADVLSIQGVSGGTTLRTTLTDSGGSALTLAEDAEHDEPSVTTGPQLMGACDDTSTDAVTEGDAAAVRVDCTSRALVTRTMDPCSGTKTPHVVNMSTATTVEIANAVASQFFHICSVNLVAAAAQTIAIGEDDTDGCGSITAGLHGGATAATGWSFGANGGIALGNGQGTVMKTATAARYLCIITGQAVQLSGTIMYVSAPAP